MTDDIDPKKEISDSTEVRKQFDVTRKRIKEIEEKALRKLRQRDDDDLDDDPDDDPDAA